MADYNEMTNSMIEIIIGDKSFRAKRLALDEIFGLFEPMIISEKVKQAKQISALLDGTEKTEFLRGVWRDLPSGAELSELVQSEMMTIRGIKQIILTACQKVDEKVTLHDLEDLISADTLEEISPIVEFLCGVSKEKKQKGTPNSKKAKA